MSRQLHVRICGLECRIRVRVLSRICVPAAPGVFSRSRYGTVRVPVRNDFPHTFVITSRTKIVRQGVPRLPLWTPSSSGLRCAAEQKGYVTRVVARRPQSAPGTAAAGRLRRRRRRKLLVLDTVVVTRRRCRVRLCVPRGGGAPLGASMLWLNNAVVSNAAPTGTVARFPRRRPHVTQLSGILSRTRFYAIDVHVHRACKVWLYPVKKSSIAPGPQPSPPGPISQEIARTRLFSQE